MTIEYDAFLEMYKEGLLKEDFAGTDEEWKSYLKKFKEECTKEDGKYTDEFRKVIAMRDINGVGRIRIKNELCINYNTVKSACEKFGNSNKNRSITNLYQQLENAKESIDSNICPECKKANLNKLDFSCESGDSYYCKNCGNEFVVIKNKIHKVNWEMLD